MSITQLWLLFFVFILGANIGSFLNVVIDRVPKELSIMGRSYCDYCKHKLAWFDLIPLFSYFYLRGRCRYCDRHISLQNPIVELLTGVLFLIFFLKTGVKIDYSLLFNWFIVSAFIIIAVVDFKEQIILDEPLILLLLLSLYINRDLLPFHLATSIILASWFLLIYYLSGKIAMGYGDVKLIFVMGMLMPMPYVLYALYLAFLTGGIVSAILIIARRKHFKSQIAFGPFLTLGFLVIFAFLR